MRHKPYMLIVGYLQPYEEYKKMTTYPTTNKLEEAKQKVLNFETTVELYLKHNPKYLRAQESPEQGFKRLINALSDLIEICAPLEFTGKL